MFSLPSYGRCIRSCFPSMTWLIGRGVRRPANSSKIWQSPCTAWSISLFKTATVTHWWEWPSKATALLFKWPLESVIIPEQTRRSQCKGQNWTHVQHTYSRRVFNGKLFWTKAQFAAKCQSNSQNSNPHNSSPQAMNLVFDNPQGEYIRGWKNPVDGNHASSRQRHGRRKKPSSLPRLRRVRHVRKRQGRYWGNQSQKTTQESQAWCTNKLTESVVMLGFKYWSKQVS